MQNLECVGRRIQFPQPAHGWQSEVFLALGQVRLTVKWPVAGEDKLPVGRIAGHDVVISRLVCHFREDWLHVCVQLGLRGQSYFVELPKEWRVVVRSRGCADDHAEDRFALVPVNAWIARRYGIRRWSAAGDRAPIRHGEQVYDLMIQRWNCIGREPDPKRSAAPRERCAAEMIPKGRDARHVVAGDGARVDFLGHWHLRDEQNGICGISREGGETRDIAQRASERRRFIRLVASSYSGYETAPSENRRPVFTAGDAPEGRAVYIFR